MIDFIVRPSKHTTIIFIFLRADQRFEFLLILIFLVQHWESNRYCKHKQRVGAQCCSEVKTEKNPGRPVGLVNPKISYPGDLRLTTRVQPKIRKIKRNEEKREKRREKREERRGKREERREKREERREKKREKRDERREKREERREKRDERRE